MVPLGAEASPTTKLECPVPSTFEYSVPEWDSMRPSAVPAKNVPVPEEIADVTAFEGALRRRDSVQIEVISARVRVPAILVPAYLLLSCQRH